MDFFLKTAKTSLFKNSKWISCLLKKKIKWERRYTMLTWWTAKYSRNIKLLILFVWFFLLFFFSISVPILYSFPRRCLLKQSFGRLFSPKPLEVVEWRWQKLNDDFKMTDNIIPYYYCLVDCQRTNVLQTSNVINSEPQIWITNLQYMCGFSRKKKIWSGAEKYPFA